MLTDDTDVAPVDAAEAGAASKLVVRYALAVWGEGYIDRFWSDVFPTHLAPNNLPTLSQLVDLRFCILTRDQDRSLFDRHPMSARMRELGTVEFVAIDDLISSNAVYAVTLTFAFTRAIRVAGEGARTDCFLFMNADFMLADGTLATVGRRLAAGASAVLAVTPRAISEDVAAKLRDWPREANGALVLTPRQMVAFALTAPHCMVTAKQPDAHLLHSTVPNQFFWFVDNNTLLARSYLAFMLAVRPRTAGYQATNFCDYSMVEDLADPDRLSLLTDSDDGFILELQGRRQEADTVRLGPLSDETAVGYLGAWTTSFHRWTAQHDFLFRSGGAGAGLPAARLRARRYIDGLAEQLPPPVDPHAHPYWVGGVQAWRLHRARMISPPELSTTVVADHGLQPAGHVRLRSQPIPDLPRLYHWLARVAAPLRRRLRQRPAHADFDSLRRYIAECSHVAPVQLYGTTGLPLQHLVGRRARLGLPLAALNEVAQSRWAELAGTLTLVCLNDSDLSPLAAAVAHSNRIAAAGGTSLIIIERRAVDPIAFHVALADALSQADQSALRQGVAVLMDDTRLRDNESALAAALAQLRARPTVRRLAGVVAKTLVLSGNHVFLRVRPHVSGAHAQWPGMAIAFAPVRGKGSERN